MTNREEIPEEFIKSSDGCTLWPDLWYGDPCCYIHDYESTLDIPKIDTHFNLSICVIRDTYYHVHDAIDPFSPFLADILSGAVIPIGGVIAIAMLVGLVYLNKIYLKFKNKGKSGIA